MSTDATEPRRRGPLARFRRDPGKPPGRIRQIVQLFHATRRADPAVVWWMLLAFAGVMVVGLTIGILTGHPIYVSVLALPFAVLAAMFIMARRAEAAAYKQIEGQPGAAGAALRVLRRGWTVEESPVAIDPRTHDSVFRAIGRPGVVLVGDGPPHRIGKLLGTEEKKLKRVLSGVPIHLVQAGDGEGQVPLPKVGPARDEAQAHPHQGRGHRRPQAGQVDGRREATHPQGHRPDARPARPEDDAWPLIGPPPVIRL